MTITTYKCPKCGNIAEVVAEYVEIDGTPLCIDCFRKMVEEK